MLDSNEANRGAPNPSTHSSSLAQQGQKHLCHQTSAFTTSYSGDYNWQKRMHLNVPRKKTRVERTPQKPAPGCRGSLLPDLKCIICTLSFQQDPQSKGSCASDPLEPRQPLVPARTRRGSERRGLRPRLLPEGARNGASPASVQGAASR